MLGQEKYNRFLICSEFAVENANNIGDLLDKLNNSKRKEYQKMNENKYTLVDFFCGAGGLSLGFIQQGFNVKLANDIEDVCIETYLYNHPQLSSKKIIKGDIKEIVDNVESYLDTDIDVVVGGPPCQGFSSANQHRIIDDPRNKLYKYFIQAVEKIVPKFVVMENVRGMLKVADQVVEDYKNLKTEKDGIEYTYDVSYELLNAKDFSVAQSRERLIYIAIRNDVIDSLNISPDEIFKEIKEDCSDNLIFTLNDALMDIKPLEAQRIKNMNEVDDKKTGKKIDVNEFGLTNNPYLNLINEGRPIYYIFNHKSRYVNDINYEIYRRLNEGEDATNEKIADIMPYANRNHIFKDKYY